ncbi:hypothetical protein LQW54_006134 [Pestalotiopsis sp. IQ-011]
MADDYQDAPVSMHPAVIHKEVELDSEDEARVDLTERAERAFDGFSKAEDLWDTTMRVARRSETRLAKLAYGVQILTHPASAESVTITRPEHGELIGSQTLTEALL